MFKKEIEKIKKMNEEKNLFLYGVKKPEKDIGNKILKVVQYLFDGYSVVEGVDYKLEKGWLYVVGSNLNEQKIAQLKFKSYKNGYIRKVFNKNNQFVFKII